MLAPAIFTSIPADIVVVLLIVLLFFGPKRLPGLGRSIGSGIREFKDGISGSSDPQDEKKSDLGAGTGAGESGHAG
ncbi:MAG: Sec-independent protein translocase subunit TatA/TatB [Solirubrobacteraceae bacterium]